MRRPGGGGVNSVHITARRQHSERAQQRLAIRRYMFLLFQPSEYR
jgi:hypothetical protein